MDILDLYIYQMISNDLANPRISKNGYVRICKDIHVKIFLHGYPCLDIQLWISVYGYPYGYVD